MERISDSRADALREPTHQRQPAISGGNPDRVMDRIRLDPIEHAFEEDGV